MKSGKHPTSFYQRLWQTLGRGEVWRGSFVNRRKDGTTYHSDQTIAPMWKNYLYLGLYNLAYMFDDSVMLTIAVVTLSHRKMQEREGRWLKLISGTVMLGLGLTMVFRPDWLS